MVDLRVSWRNGIEKWRSPLNSDHIFTSNQLTYIMGLMQRIKPYDTIGDFVLIPKNCLLTRNEMDVLDNMTILRSQMYGYQENIMEKIQDLVLEDRKRATKSINVQP